jgi:hypothetical protein
MSKGRPQNCIDENKKIKKTIRKSIEIVVYSVLFILVPR